MVVHSAAAAAAAAAAVDARGQAALPGMNMLIKVGTDRHEQSEKKGQKTQQNRVVEPTLNTITGDHS